MGEWLMIVACVVLVGVAAYLWHLKTKAEGAKSNLEVELKGLRDANEQLRKDDAADLDRQAKQYDAQISDLNDKLKTAQQKTEAAQAEVRRLESEASVSKTSLDEQKRRIADMTKHYEDLLGTMKDEFKSLSEDVLKEKKEQFEKDGVTSVSKLTDSLKQEIESFRKRADMING